MAQNRYPQWESPVKTPKNTFVEPAVSNASVYTEILEDKQIQSLSKECQEETLDRLLNDVSSCARLNALHILSKIGHASPHTLDLVRVQMKSTDPEMAGEAFSTLCALQPDRTEVIRDLLEAMLHTESNDVKRKLMAGVLADQAAILALIDTYFTAPKTYEIFLKKILRSNPSDETIQKVLSGLDRKVQTPDCIATTIEHLLGARTPFDSPKIRTILVDLIRKPISLEYDGLMSRINSLKILKNFVSNDKPKDKDQDLVSALTDLYHDAKNSEIKARTKELLAFMGAADGLDVDEDEIYD